MGKVAQILFIHRDLLEFLLQASGDSKGYKKLLVKTIRLITISLSTSAVMDLKIKIRSFSSKNSWSNILLDLIGQIKKPIIHTLCEQSTSLKSFNFSLLLCADIVAHNLSLKQRVSCQLEIRLSLIRVCFQHPTFLVRVLIVKPTLQW